MTPYRVIDLFAGCGGLSLGFELSGKFRAVLAVEMDSDAAETYASNFKKTPVKARPIEAITTFPSADVIVGGPPCQAFSLLNRHGVGSERRALWRHYVRALKSSGSSAFLMENVPELLRSDEYELFLAEARLEGFTVEGRVLNAADFGVPQTRKRAIVLGVKGAAPVWPEPTHSNPTDQPILGTKPWVTFREAVRGLPVVPNGRGWHRARSPRDFSLERYRAVPHDGGNRFQMQEALDAQGRGELVPRCWREKPSGTTDVFGRLWWDRPAGTIRTEFYKPEKGRYLHPSEDRPITVREAARLMTFPDDFDLPEGQSMTAIGRQIGNAVPPLLARRLAEGVAATLDSRHQSLGSVEAVARAA